MTSEAKEIVLRIKLAERTEKKGRIKTPIREGIAEIREELTARVVASSAGSEFPAVTRERHRRLLVEAEQHLARAAIALDQGSELAAEDVRLAARALERVSGRIDPEEILGLVFSQFCIGK